MKIKDDFVSVVVVNYNGRRFLKECLDSISFQSAHNYEIILVDNNSTDDSVDFVKKNYPHVKIVQCSVGHGFAGGSNIGIRNSRGRYVILLNTDTRIETNFVDVLYNEITSRSDCPLVGTSIYDGVNPPPVKYSSGFSILGYSLSDNTMELTYEPFRLSGCAFILDRHKIPVPFDDDYFMFYEDNYLTWLNQLKGYRVFNTFDTIVLHYGSGSTGKRSRLKVFHGEKNRILNLILFYSNGTLIILLPLILVNLLVVPLRAILVYRRETYVAEYLKSYLWILTHFGLVMEKRWKIQAQRRVSDNEIMTSTFTYKISDGMYSKTLNTIAKLYCKIVGIRTFNLK